ncbi:hypothetical protein [Humibacter ginsenosidimutans]|uniref:hypothetical protein n=1 Tax=Humibacter ginsenosidimutans TaxID=2599293 RepID=UPI00349E7F71
MIGPNGAGKTTLFNVIFRRRATHQRKARDRRCGCHALADRASRQSGLRPHVPVLEPVRSAHGAGERATGRAGPARVDGVAGAVPRAGDAATRAAREAPGRGRAVSSRRGRPAQRRRSARSRSRWCWLRAAVRRSAPDEPMGRGRVPPTCPN